MIIPLPAGVKQEAACGACSNMIRVPQVEEKEQSRIPCFSKVITFPAAAASQKDRLDWIAVKEPIFELLQ